MAAEVKTQLIHGCTSAKLRRKGLTDGTITLAKHLSEGRSMEIVEKQSKSIEQALKETSINKVAHQHNDSRRQRQETSTSGGSKCLNCGGKYPHQGGMRSCPAQGVRCDACGRVGHFRKWCLSTKSAAQPKPVYKPQPKPGYKRRYTHKSPAKPVHNIEVSSDDEHYAFTCLQTCSQSQPKSQPKFSVQIDGNLLMATADTGASCSLMSDQTYNSLQHVQSLRQADVNIKPYNGGRMNIGGKFEAHISFNNKYITETLFVVKGHGVTLFGYSASERLQLVTVHHANSINNSLVEEYVTRHPQLFTGVGKMADFQVDLHIDKTVSPVAQPHRRIPFHARKKLEAELDALEKNDIIERVDGPTPWVTPIVIAPKPKDPEAVRVCVDMRQPNKAIIRERHIAPTIDDIQINFNGSTVFSKLDLRQAYHQLEHTPES